MKKLINFILEPFRRYKTKQLLRRRLEELRKRDPFIYK